MRTSPRSEPALASGSGTLRAALLAVVRRRVPEHEAEDLVQEVFAEALVAPTRPEEPEALVRFLHGIARHKVADLHRARARARGRAPEQDVDVDRLPAAPAGETDADARALLAWAERQVGASAEARATLALLVREGDGEKLEHLAEELAIPAPRLRKRVSRLRAELRARWLAAAAAALVVAGALALWFARRAPTPRPLAIEPEAPVVEGRRRRALALEQCPDLAPRACLDALDGARALDPAGDDVPDVRAARARAARALAPSPSPSPSSSVAPSPPPAPSSSASPAPTPAPSSPAPPPTERRAPAKPGSDVGSSGMGFGSLGTGSKGGGASTAAPSGAAGSGP